MTTPTAKPCLNCGTTGGYIRARVRVTPDRTRGLCNRCKARERTSGAYWDRPLSGWHGPADHPLDLPAMIAAKARAITAAEIAERCADAALELEESAEVALIYAEYWRWRRPEQFTPEAIAALYPDPAGLAFSAWADDAARRAA